MNESGLSTLPQYNVSMQQFPLYEHYPEIVLNCNGITQTSGHFLTDEANSSWHNIIVPVNEGAIKRIVRTFHEHGFKHALNEARTADTAEQCPIIASAADIVHKAGQALKTLKSKLLPHTHDIDANYISIFAETRDWRDGYIRYIVWHPNCFKIAVAGLDDIIRIYTNELTIMPVLKFGKQKLISSMAWRPFSSSELAVACETGVVLWNTLRTGAQPEFLKHPCSKPVMSVQWSQDGSLLAASSIGDMNIIIWNVDSQQSTLLARTGPPCSLLKWSPNGTYLFSGTVGKIFRVWRVADKWKPERWTCHDGFVQSACWSPCNNFLLFVSSEDRLLYCLQFNNQYFASNDLANQAVVVADLSRVTIDKHSIGGKPQQVAWDPSGLYLAISFKDTSCIAIFSTTIQKDIIISPSCFIPGKGTEHPAFICFESMHRQNKNVVLTIGWSNGHVQFIPFQ